MRIKVLSFFIFFTLPVLLFAQDELTITTYYPSPYGSYNELQLVAHADPVTSCTDQTKGTMYLDSDDNLIYICQGLSEGWQPLSGYWAPTTADPNNIYNKNSGNVGIGTGDNPVNYRLLVKRALGTHSIAVVDDTSIKFVVDVEGNIGIRDIPSGNEAIAADGDIVATGLIKSGRQNYDVTLNTLRSMNNCCTASNILEHLCCASACNRWCKAAPRRYSGGTLSEYNSGTQMAECVCTP